jgi:lysozyme
VAVNPRIAGASFLLVLALAGGVTATFEGNPPVSYNDSIPNNPTPTACRGHTGPDVVVGKPYTQAQCDKWFVQDLVTAAQGVQACVHAPMAPNQLAAFTSTSYNIGITAFCRSSMARLANAGDRLGSCKAILLYVYAGGKKLLGLERRRQSEYKLCVTP